MQTRQAAGAPLQRETMDDRSAEQNCRRNTPPPQLRFFSFAKHTARKFGSFLLERFLRNSVPVEAAVLDWLRGGVKGREVATHRASKKWARIVKSGRPKPTGTTG